MCEEGGGFEEYISLTSKALVPTHICTKLQPDLILRYTGRRCWPPEQMPMVPQHCLSVKPRWLVNVKRADSEPSEVWSRGSCSSFPM